MSVLKHLGGLKKLRELFHAGHPNDPTKILRMDSLSHMKIDEQFPHEFLAMTEDDEDDVADWSTTTVDRTIVKEEKVDDNVLDHHHRMNMPVQTPYNNLLETKTQVQNVKEEEMQETEKKNDSVPDQRKSVKNVEYFAKKNIDRYLKRRGFNTRSVKKPETLTLDNLVDNMRKAFGVQDGLNSISCGANYEVQDIIVEIERFWKFYHWMKTEDISPSLQLRPMLIPILVYFYTECLLSGVISVAAQIFATFSNKFYDEERTEEDYSTLTHLANISRDNNFQSATLKDNPTILQIKERKYHFRVNPWVFEQLQKFIQTSKLPVMVNLLTQQFIIHIEDSDAIGDCNLESAQVSSSISNSETTSPSSACTSDGTKREIDQVIRNLRGSTIANMPSIQVYTTNGKAVCGAVSKHGSMIAFGMAEAGIRIFEAPLVEGAFDSKIPAESIGSDYTVKLMSGHNGLVSDLGFHPRAKYIFSVGEDASMRIWDAHNNICRAIYRGHHCPIWSLDISSTGNLIVTGSMDTTARIWVPERTDFVRLLVGHYFDVDCVKFHPNEAYVATGSVDKSVRLWSVADGNLVRLLTGSKGAITCIGFHKDGKYIAAAGEDKMIRIWDLGEGKIVAELEGIAHCRDLSFYDNMLAAAYEDRTIRVWNIQDLINPSHPTKEEDVRNNSTNPQIISAKTETIVKLYYKNLSKLYCLGSMK